MRRSIEISVTFLLSRWGDRDAINTEGGIATSGGFIHAVKDTSIIGDAGSFAGTDFRHIYQPGTWATK